MEPPPQKDMSFGMTDEYVVQKLGEVMPHRMTTSPFTSSFAVGAIPTPTFPPETFNAPATVLSCETMSFHAAEDSVVPAFGNAHQAAAAKAETAQTDAKARANQRPRLNPSMRGFLFVSIFGWRKTPNFKKCARFSCAQF